MASRIFPGNSVTSFPPTKELVNSFTIENYNTGSNANSDIIIGLENKVRNVHKSIIKKKPQDDNSILRRNFDTSFWD